MNKKTMSIMIALLFSATALALVSAKKIDFASGLSLDALPEVKQIYPYRKNPEVKIAEGVAFDKEKLESKQVVFMIMRYGDKENIYLIIKDQTYKMTEVTNSTNDLGPGTKIIYYKSGDGSILTILAQSFEDWGQISISGDFKNYMITFKPMYYYEYAKPVQPYPTPLVTQTTEASGEETIEKEIIKQNEPVIKGLEEVARREAMNIDDILQKPTKTITEWID